MTFWAKLQNPLIISSIKVQDQWDIVLCGKANSRRKKNYLGFQVTTNTAWGTSYLPLEGGMSALSSKEAPKHFALCNSQLRETRGGHSPHTLGLFVPVPSSQLLKFLLSHKLPLLTPMGILIINTLLTCVKFAGVSQHFLPHGQELPWNSSVRFSGWVWFFFSLS